MWPLGPGCSFAAGTATFPITAYTGTVSESEPSNPLIGAADLTQRGIAVFEAQRLLGRDSIAEHPVPHDRTTILLARAYVEGWEEWTRLVDKLGRGTRNTMVYVAVAALAFTILALIFPLLSAFESEVFPANAQWHTAYAVLAAPLLLLMPFFAASRSYLITRWEWRQRQVLAENLYTIGCAMQKTDHPAIYEFGSLNDAAQAILLEETDASTWL